LPIIFEYLGIIIQFYSNEHEPIHVHGIKNRRQCKAEFILLEGKIVEIRISPIKGYLPLKNRDLQNFKAFIEQYADKIIQKWVEYFVYHKKVEVERISRRIK